MMRGRGGLEGVLVQCRIFRGLPGCVVPDIHGVW